MTTKPGFVEMTASILERLGYRVTSATDSLDAMRLFSDSPQSFDLIVTDQTMPELTGVELAGKALSIRKDVPILLCTGYSEMVSPETAQAAGIRGFLLKPIRKNQMAQAIRRVLNNEKTSRKPVERTNFQP